MVLPHLHHALLYADGAATFAPRISICWWCCNICATHYYMLMVLRHLHHTLIYADGTATFAPRISICWWCCNIYTTHYYMLMLLRHLHHTLIHADGSATFAPGITICWWCWHTCTLAIFDKTTGDFSKLYSTTKHKLFKTKPITYTWSYLYHIDTSACI